MLGRITSDNLIAAPSPWIRASPPGFVPDRSVDVLVEGGTSRGELAHVVLLGSHQGCAIAEGPAQPLVIEGLPIRHPEAEIGLGKRTPANPHEPGPARADV